MERLLHASKVDERTRAIARSLLPVIAASTGEACHAYCDHLERSVGDMKNNVARHRGQGRPAVDRRRYENVGRTRQRAVQVEASAGMISDLVAHFLTDLRVA